MEQQIQDFMRSMATNDANEISKWFTDESTVWIPPAQPVSGLNRITALFRAMFRRYEKLEWTILDIIPVSDTRCFHICASKGCLKNGTSYTNQVITDIHFDQHGKILVLSDHFKDTSVFA